MSLWIFKMSSCGSKADMETSVPPVNGIVNNALLRSILRIIQTLHQITHILHYCLVDSLLNYSSDFAVNLIEVRAVRWPQMSGISERWPWSVRLLHFQSVGSEWCTECLGKHSMRRKITVKSIYQNWYCGVATYNQIMSDVCRNYSKSVYKFTTSSCNWCYLMH